MGNIKNFNFAKLKLQISNSDYWDFYLANDESSGDCDSLLSGSCFVVWYDFNNSNTFLSGLTTNIHSLVSWSGATNSGYTLNTIGLTGIDNGLITFDKVSGDTTNQALLSALTESVYVIQSGNTGLMMNAVTGTTSGLTYDILVNSGLTEGQYMDFMGGFYQGFYKLDGKTYEVLPTRVNHSWSAEFWLKPKDVNTTGTTINDLYPNNKGFFFYMGTRAENKFWNRFEGVDTGCTSACTVDTGCTDNLSYWCTLPKETDIFIGSGDTEISLSPNQIITNEITNPFLIYGRAGRVTRRCSSCGANPSGFGSKSVCDYDGKPIITKTPKTVKSNTQNPFLIYGRAGRVTRRCSSCGANPSGLGDETVCSFSGFEESIQFSNIDYNLDIIDNSIGFRIKDDGSIGYRMLTVTGTCSGTTYISGVTIEEKYSKPGLITNNLWTSVIIRYTTDFYDDCKLKVGPKRKGKLMFYINGKLKFTVNNFSEFIAKRLDEYMEKQIGVPFNFSLGGGSQGLIETQTFDGRDLADLGLPIESNFAGTFVGGISKFKFNICDLYFDDIQNIYNSEVPQYVSTYGGFILQENGWYILQENKFKITLE